MKIRSFTNCKFWKKTGLAILLLYALIWSIGYYRVSSTVRELEVYNKMKGDRIEDFILSIKEGDDESKLDPVLDICETKYEGEITHYFLSYETLVQETSSVSNRVSKCYRLESINGKIIKKVNQGGLISHGDRFISHWRFYPTVCFLGLRTYENE